MAADETDAGRAEEYEANKSYIEAVQGRENAKEHEKLDGFNMTELGDTKFFISKNSDKMRYDHTRKKWFYFNCHHWYADTTGYVSRVADEAIQERQRIAEEYGTKEAKSWALRGESRSRLNNMIALAQDREPMCVDGSNWDRDAWSLGVKNGVVDLRTGELRSGRPEDMITMHSPENYDPSARSDVWEKALSDIFAGDQEIIDFLQILGGYSITGDTSQDKWFMSYGQHGREGKGTIYGAWSAAIGTYHLELPSSVFDIRRTQEWDLAKLPGKRFVTSSETGNTLHLHHERIKMMTGGSEMRVAEKYQNSFQFTPSCKLWLACNELPRVADDSLAFWARVFVIPFKVSFHGRANTRLRPMLQEMSEHRRAVLTWLVKGAVKYAEHGFDDPPAGISHATAYFKNASWPLTDFVLDECVEGPGLRMTIDQLTSAYEKYCRKMNVTNRLGFRRLLQCMESRYKSEVVNERGEGANHHQRTRYKIFNGIAIRERSGNVEEF